ncbi:MAG: hypothetical protein IT555_11575, partial [Acetobacteraceae bacterium]|nr:hypothetical protein [Acetobacteraceae bacterium]
MTMMNTSISASTLRKLAFATVLLGSTMLVAPAPALASDFVMPVATHVMADASDAGEGAAFRTSDASDAGEGAAFRTSDASDAGEGAAFRTSDASDAGEGAAFRTSDASDAG